MTTERRRATRPCLSDVAAGVSAAAVVIPQGVAYAVLAGVPAERGLFVAALAPIAAAVCASSPYLGSGPTAVTALLTLGALSPLAEPGSGEFVALASLLALLVGAIRVAMGLARLGFVSFLVSQPVLSGFTTGAAVVIVATQVPVVFDVDASGRNPLLGAVEALSEPGAFNTEAVALAVAAGLVVAAGRRFGRRFPGVPLAVAGALAYSAATGYDGRVVGEIGGRFPPLSLDLPWSDVSLLAGAAFVIAVVGFAEPAAIARHYATLDRTRWKPDRELVSQGLANLAAGVGGGFPAGGSFSRSAILRGAGARTRWAGAITGVTALGALPFLGLLRDVPSSALGAVIVASIAPLIRVAPFMEYRRYTRLQFTLALVTFALTVGLAPHVERAVAIGVGLAIGSHLWRELRVSVKAWTEGDTLSLAPKGVLYFASAPILEKRFGDLLADHPDARTLVVHLGGLGRIDVTGALALRSLLENAEEAGLSTSVVDVPFHAQKIVARVLGRDIGAQA